MAWTNKGMVFRTSDWVTDRFAGHFAQSPQALVLDDRVRVFFSTRTRTADDQPWLSHVMRVDFDLDFAAPIAPPVAVHLAPSALGAFDEHGIFPFSVVTHGDEVWAYTTGWSRRVGVSVETGIGLAVSSDGGESFTRHDVGPVMSASLHEPFLVCDGFVRRIADSWRMWYCFGTAWISDPSTGVPERTYKIGVASSPDGLRWTPAGGRQAIPSGPLGDREAQALPTVLDDFAGGMGMAFCFRDTFAFRDGGASAYRLGFAASNDGGMTWQRDDAGIAFPSADFDDSMRCYPHLTRVRGRTFLLFNGNEFGRDGFGVAEWKPDA